MGDLVERFFMVVKSKYGTWNSPPNVLSFDTEAGSITVPGRSHKTISGAVEDTRVFPT